MQKAVCTILTFTFLILLVSPLQASDLYIPESPPLTFNEAVQDANREITEQYGMKYDFYSPYNVAGAALNSATWNTGVDVDMFVNCGINEEAKVLVYGNPWHDGSSSYGINRYLGYTMQGHPFTNPEHPFDTDLRGQKLENLEWIKTPWRNTNVNIKIQSELGNLTFDQTSTSFCGDASLRDSMALGLMFDGYKGTTGGHLCVIGNEGWESFPWHEYVYVYQPPTEYNWGVGRMFRYIDPAHPSVSNMGYKTVLMPAKSIKPPDFYPTPKGESDWKESYLTNAKTYNGEPGEEITIPITIHNKGFDSITDFAATWYGTGWSNPLIHEQNISIPAGGHEDFDLKVTVPQSGEETRLVIKANVDGKTPAWEFPLLQGNNQMIINVREPGVDLAGSVEPVRSYMELSWVKGSMITPAANVCISRLDSGTETITAEVTLVSPSGTNTTTIALEPGGTIYQDMSYTTNKSGNYKFSASVMPLGNIEDTDTSNNYDSCTITIVNQKEPERQDSDSGIRGGLGG